MGEHGGRGSAWGGLIASMVLFGVMLGATTGACAAQAPVAAYSFDTGEGTTLEDVSGAEHEGTIEGAKWTKGKFGNALTFNGASTEKVTIPDSNDLDLTDELTLEAWVRPTETIEWSAIVSKVRGSGISYQLTAHADHNAPVGYLANAEKEWGVDGGTTPLPAKIWSHIAFTSDGNRIRFYVDGKLKGSDSMLVAAEPSAGPLVIGGETFKGKIDEVRLYDRALDEDELTADKGAPIQTPPATPVAAYSFDAGEGTTLEDVSGAEHEGTIEGAKWAKGKYGSALQFDGINDLVSIPDSNDLDLTDEFTLEAWVRPDEANKWSAVITKERGSKAVSYQMHAEGEKSAPVGYIGNSSGTYGVTAGTTPIPVHVWSHLALTYDGAKLRYYVDGVLKGTASASDPGVSADQLLIGGNISWGAEDAFKGLIDEVRLYDRALDEGEINADKGAALPNPPTAVTGGAEVLGSSEAILLGTVDPNDTETKYAFEYGTTTAYGQMAPATEEELLYENSDQEAEEAVAYLQPNTTYHYRLKATNRAGTAAGEDKTLTTPPSEVSPEQEKVDREEEENYTASISTVAPDFVGLNFSGLQERTNADMEKVAETGASMYRISLEDLTHFSADAPMYDDVFRNAAANGMKVLFVLGSRHLTTNKAGLATWVERIVRRYGKARAGKAGSLWTSEKAPYAPTAWEVWNEPNIGLNSLNPPPKAGPDSPPANQRPGNVDPKKFGDYLEVMSKAIKNVEPSATVVLGGLLSVGTSQRNEAEEREGKEDEITPGKFLSRMGHTDDYDAVGFHPYAFRANNGGPPKEGPNEGKEINEVRLKVRNAIVRLRKKLDHLKGGENKKLWITEVGWPVGIGDGAHPAVTPNIQAKLLRAVFSTIKKRAKPWNIANVFYFNYRDAPRGTPQALAWDFNTGLLDPQGNPKPAFEAFQLQAK